MIIVDDESTDGSEKIVDGFTEDERVTVIHQDNTGVSAARNKGFAIATGVYVTFIDADDEVIAGSLDGIMPYLTGEDDLLIAGAISEGQDAIPIFKDTVFEGADAKVALNFILTSWTKERRIPGRATQFMSGCKEKFYRREFVYEHRFCFDEELIRNEDVLWSCHCYYAAEQIHFLPVTVYVNKEDPNGITKGTDIQKTVNSFTAFIEKFNAFFQDKLDIQILGNFYFHQSAIVNYDFYRAMKLGRIKGSQFRTMMKSWYTLDASRFMLKHLKGSELTPFKRIAFYLMKMRCYRLVGFEMSVHHRHK